VLRDAAVTYEIVVVDDGSSDATWQAIGSFAQRAPALRALRLSRRFGKEAALRAGLETRAAARRSRWTATCSIRRDDPAMISAWRSGADIVEAVKEDRSAGGAIESWRARLFYGCFAA
jgi:glycosyltransferase involved in cell wall biosynthesis